MEHEWGKIADLSTLTRVTHTYKKTRNSLYYCFIMSGQTENILASLQATDRAEDDFVAPASHPPNAPFLLAVPAGQSSKR